MKTITFIILLFVCTAISRAQEPDIPANPVVPSPQQIAYQNMEIIGFIHYTVNAFTDKEWGDGSEAESVFNPTELDVKQWVAAAKAGGMQQLILTAKHHDGFCLWPSAYTEHSVKNSPYKNGKGDIVGELAQACRDAGLKFGVYLSPWDRNHADYARPEYITYYRNQLRDELLASYGEISEMWFDGANGGTGWYGGAKERRTIDRKTYYDWPTTWALAKQLQPNILIFSDAGPDIHWIGNEKGIAGETFWSMFDRSKVAVGDADVNYLNSGDPNGPDWVVGECDVSIRPGWFYHKKEDGRVKTPQQLLDLYFKSVGRNGTMLLNIPPDQRGLIHENDVAALKGFKKLLDETFALNLAAGKKVQATSQWADSKKFSAGNITDDDVDSYWAAEDGDNKAVLTIDLGEAKTFNVLMLQEPTRLGQRIAEFSVEAQTENGRQKIAEGTTIGHKRLLRFEPVSAAKIRINLLKANNTPAISNVGLFLSNAF